MHNPFYKCLFKNDQTFFEFADLELPDNPNIDISQFPIFSTLYSNVQTYLREALRISEIHIFEVQMIGKGLENEPKH